LNTGLWETSPSSKEARVKSQTCDGKTLCSGTSWEPAGWKATLGEKRHRVVVGKLNIS